jgi:glutamyl-tRNA synthetase
MSNPSNKVVTRIAPSPTGNLHIGTVRTALFSFLYARKHGGTFAVRIEDTDRERSKPEFEQNIMSGLEWLGIKHDEGAFVRQSERAPQHAEYVRKMIASGHAFVSDERGREGFKEGGRESVIRFKNPNKIVTFKDEIRGLIEFDTTDLGDFVIAKAEDEPLYHLAVVADDFDMGVTHVIRGEDHISNTPRQILIQDAIGAPRPVYAHLPLILAPDRSKMSKRHGAISIDEYRSQGYAKEAILNYIGLLGFNPGDDRDILSLDDMIQAFSFDRVSKGGAIFDMKRFDWFNKQYINAMTDEQVLGMLYDELPAAKDAGVDVVVLASIIRERMERLTDVNDMVKRGELAYVVAAPTLTKEALLWKGKQDSADAVRHLEYVKDKLGAHAGRWEAERLKKLVWDYATESGRGDVLWPLRMALSGLEKSPDPFVLATLLGKAETLSRIDAALALLK